MAGHELQMAHPYSFSAAQDLVETSLILSGRLSATLGLLGAGRIDYRRAQILTDLLGTCSTEVRTHRAGDGAAQGTWADPG